LARVASDPLGYHDLDLGGSNLASFMLATTLILLIMILIFVVLVVTIGDPCDCGVGCTYW